MLGCASPQKVIRRSPKRAIAEELLEKRICVVAKVERRLLDDALVLLTVEERASDILHSLSMRLRSDRGTFGVLPFAWIKPVVCQ